MYAMFALAGDIGCSAGPGRGRDHLPVYRKNESWDPYCHSLPVRNADTGIPFKASEDSIKAGYLLRNN